MLCSQSYSRLLIAKELLALSINSFLSLSLCSLSRRVVLYISVNTHSLTCTVRFTVASPDEKAEAEAEAEEGGEALTYIQNEEKPMTYIPIKHTASTFVSRGCLPWNRRKR